MLTKNIDKNGDKGKMKKDNQEHAHSKRLN